MAPVRRSLRLRLAAAGLVACAAVPARADLRILCWNVGNGVGDPGSAAFLAAREVITRLRPDVIAFQEVDAGDADPTAPGHFGALRRLLTECGFQTTRDHLATAGDGFEGQTFVAAEFGNTSQSLAMASRYPITRTVQIGRGVEGKREFTRFPLFVQIDVPGTAHDPAFVNVHFKLGDTRADEFRRGIESLRVRQFLEAGGIHGAAHHLFVLGDFNEEIAESQTAEFPTAGIAGGFTFTDGSSLPAMFQLGPDVPAVMPYRTFPTSAFAAVGLSPVPATQSDGSTDRTYALAGDARIDYILTGGFTRAAGTVRAEVYNSGREHVGDGLPKAADLPPAGLSVAASDHFPLVADVVLDPLPELQVALPAGPFPVTFAGLTPPPGSVSIPAALTTPVLVEIAPFRQAPLLPIPAVVIPSGATSAEVPFRIEGAPFGPSRRITLVASAPGFRDGLGTVATRRDGVSGAVIISQYTETPAGTMPKAIEVLNISGRELAFATEPLRVLAYVNGSALPSTEVLVEIGRLEPGGVAVIGDATTGAHLVAQGLLPDTTTNEIDAAQTGAVFTGDGSLLGPVRFVKNPFTFNGDDAIELQLNGARSDVFGQPGNDPGAAWTTPGAPAVSTNNQNLSRRPAAMAPSPGWTSPGIWFETAGTSQATALSGFGVAPLSSDPYSEWAAARGLTGSDALPMADPDGNDLANVIDFIFGNTAAAPRLSGGAATFETSIRTRVGAWRWGAEVSPDGRQWRRVLESTAAVPAPPGEFAPNVVTRPRTDPTELLRWFVEGP